MKFFDLKIDAILPGAAVIFEEPRIGDMIWKAKIQSDQEALRLTTL